MSAIDYTLVATYLCLLAAAGFAISRLIRDSDDIFVAGRELTPFILCATITATNISIFHFVGMGGTAYQSGVSIAWQNWTGDIALVLSGLFVLPVLRRLRIRSVPEFLQLRYSKWLRVLVSLFWSLRLATYLGIILYVGATAAIIITGWNHYFLWLLVFSVVAILYSIVGGAWAVAIMDSVQFLVMLGGAMIALPIVTHRAGGMPAVVDWLRSHGQANHVTFIPRGGDFNWIWVLAILLLSMKWSTVDQSILQRAFGARSPRAGAKGMVLAGIITTPFAFFWILPGLSMAKINPTGISNPDQAIPLLLATSLPAVGRGLLGLVLCGLVSAQISVITADINSVATLFTSDVFRTLCRKPPSQRLLLIVVRISSFLCGVLMLAVAYALSSYGQGAVKANLALVGILDMPLFVITIIFGVFWKRTNWQGATAGFVVGGTVGVLSSMLVDAKFFPGHTYPALKALSAAFADHALNWHHAFRARGFSATSLPAIASATTALIVTPLISIVFAKPAPEQSEVIWQAFKAEGASKSEGEHDSFHPIPRSGLGRLGFALVVLGFVCFLTGVIIARWELPAASPMGIGGMIAVLGGGLLRVYCD